LDTAEIARGYQVESDLEHLIERRHDKRVKDEGEKAAEEMYAESVRLYHERTRRENRARWYGFHLDMHELHSRLAEEHMHKAEELCEDRGEGGS
jgi:hypothetical protein